MPHRVIDDEGDRAAEPRLVAGYSHETRGVGVNTDRFVLAISAHDARKDQIESR